MKTSERRIDTQGIDIGGGLSSPYYVDAETKRI